MFSNGNFDAPMLTHGKVPPGVPVLQKLKVEVSYICLLYTSDAADERSSVDLGGRRIIKKKNQNKTAES